MSFLPAAITVSEVVARKPSINTLVRRHKFKFPLRVYEFFTVQRPILAKAATGGLLAGLGNFIAQKYEISQHAEQQKDKPIHERQPVKEIDYHRLASFTAFNAFWCGGPTHLFFGYLARSSLTTGRKLFATHFAFNPMIYFPSYFAIYGALMGQTPTQIKDTAVREFYPAYKACVCMWVPINALQFLIIPPNFQVLYMATMNLGWSVFLSACQGGGDDDSAVSNNSTSSNSTTSQKAIINAIGTRSSSTTIPPEEAEGKFVKSRSGSKIEYVANFAEFPDLEAIQDGSISKSVLVANENEEKNSNAKKPEIFGAIREKWATGPRYYSTANCEEILEFAHDG